MAVYEVNIIVNITGHEVEASSQAEANQIVLDDAKTRFAGNIDVTEHTC